MSFPTWTLMEKGWKQLQKDIYDQDSGRYNVTTSSGVELFPVFACPKIYTVNDISCSDCNKMFNRLRDRMAPAKCPCNKYSYSSIKAAIKRRIKSGHIILPEGG